MDEKAAGSPAAFFVWLGDYLVTGKRRNGLDDPTRTPAHYRTWERKIHLKVPSLVRGNIDRNLYCRRTQRLTMFILILAILAGITAIIQTDSQRQFGYRRC